MQPSVNGWKLCRKLREFSQAPILVLATVSDPNSIAHWLDAGADDYLTRPFSSEMLVAHLQKLTRRTKLIQDNPSLLLIH
jgi:two-component system response regulator ResD